jgi:hypothetical protein
LTKTRLLLRFLKNLFRELEDIKTKYQVSVFESVSLFFEDESRYGLMTRPKRVLTVCGIKPIMPYQHKFKNLWLFGSFSPVNGDSFLMEMPFCNSDAFQAYLDEFSMQKPEEFKIIVLNNGAFHKAKKLVVPPNMALLFLPPYCPELNPAEKAWHFIKNRTAMVVHKDRMALQNHLEEIIQITLASDRAGMSFTIKYLMRVIMSKWYNCCVRQ